MIGANLSWADLSWTDLIGANLSWANLSGADLSGADLSETVYQLPTEYQRSIKYFQQQLAVTVEIDERRSVEKAIGNLEVTYQSLKRFKEEISKYRERQEMRSLDAPIQNYLSLSKELEITLGDTILQPETTASEYAKVRQCIIDERDRVFRNRHIRGHPEANFREIALLYLDGYKWQAIPAEVGLDPKKWSTVQSFYWRSVRYFAANFRDYLLE